MRSDIGPAEAGARPVRGAHERPALPPHRRIPARIWKRRTALFPVAGYLAAAITSWVAVRSWYTPGRFVAAGDIGPFVRDGLRQDLGTAWGYGITGAGSVTAEVARLPEYVAFRAVTGLGGSPIAAQQVFYFCVLFLAASGVVFAARRLGMGPVAQAVVAVLTVANPLMAVNLPNPLIPVAVGTLGFLLGCLISVRRGGGSILATVLATLPLSYLSINPPTVAVVAAVTAAGVGAAAMSDREGRQRLWRHLRWATPVTAVAHAWWIVPAVVLHATGSGAELAAVTDPDAWSWTHVNNSLANVTTLTAHWGWGMHEYLPFSSALDRAPLTYLRWALPALVAIAPLVAASTRARRVATAALAVAVASVVVGKGLHGPGAGINRALYDLPGVWLLREPMSKIGPVLLLAYLVAVAVAVDGLAARARRQRHAHRARAFATGAVGFVLVAAAVLFGLPVLTGEVAPHDRLPLPSSRVDLPAGWQEVADQVNTDPGQGKVLVLPRLPFYQATTTWGFHGVASLPRDLFSRPTLLNLPGGYFSDDATVNELVTAVEHGRSPEVVARALDALGVSHVVVRRDLSDAQAVKPVARTDALVERLDGTGLFQPATDYNSAILFRVDDFRGGPSVHRAVAAPGAAGAAGVGVMVTGIDPSAAIVEGADGLSSIVVLEPGGAERPTTITVDRSGEYRLEVAATVARSFDVSASNGVLRLADDLAVTVDGDITVEADDVVLRAPGTEAPVAVRVDDQTVPVTTEARIDVPAGADIAALGTVGSSVPLDGWSPVGDCARHDDRDPAVAVDHDPDSIRLSARAHAACVDAALPITGPAVIRGDVVVERGSGRMCLWSDAKRSCLWEQRFDASADPVEMSAPLVIPADGRLFLYADAADGRADVTYHRLRVRRLEAGPTASAPTSFRSAPVTLDAGDHPVSLTVLLPTPRLDEPSEIGNCHDRGDNPELSAAWDGTTVRVSADGGSACVFRPVTQLLPGVPYTVAFDYRTTNSLGRFCLWLEGVDRCVNDDQVLPASDTWRSHRSTVFLDEMSTDARLYVYADAEGGTENRLAVNEYRDATISPVVPISVSLTSVQSSNTTRLVDARGHGDRWDIDVRARAGRFVLALPDTNHAGWTLDGLPTGASADPVVVDGFRQGWVIDAVESEPLHLTARFEPSRWVRIATWASITVLALLVLVGAGASVRRRKNRPDLGTR